MLPWNLPLVLLAWKIGPALAAGCSVIVKPAEETPLTAPRMAEMAMEAGIPAGVFNVVPGPGPEVANPSAAHGHRRGQLHRQHRDRPTVPRYAAESNLKEVTLEMGGKNPAMVRGLAGQGHGILVSPATPRLRPKSGRRHRPERPGPRRAGRGVPVPLGPRGRRRAARPALRAGRTVISVIADAPLARLRQAWAGIAAAGEAMGRSTGITRHVFAESAPARLPPELFPALGADVLLRRKEWHAQGMSGQGMSGRGAPAFWPFASRGAALAQGGSCTVDPWAAAFTGSHRHPGARGKAVSARRADKRGGAWSDCSCIRMPNASLDVRSGSMTCRCRARRRGAAGR